MANDFKLLLNALVKQPAFMVLHFTNSNNLIEQIKQFCKDECSEYKIFYLDKSKKELEKFKDDITTIQYLNLDRKQYTMQGKFYDYLFIDALPQDRVSFFKKIYKSLKNAAPIFIFLPNSSKELSYKIEAELIECNYVASSKMQIDNYLVVSAKKMHGWSGS